MQVIIYPNSKGGIAVILPAPNCGVPLAEIARKDTPFGVPYRIIDAAFIPEDHTYRDAWTADFNSPDGIGLGQRRWLIEQCSAAVASLQVQEESAERAAAIASLQAMIAQMKAEVLEIEGVLL